MYFISIATLTEAHDFTKWMRDKGRSLEFKDSVSFQDWLQSHNDFPLEFYMDGVTYSLGDKERLEYFACGFEAAMNLRFKDDEEDRPLAKCV